MATQHEASIQIPYGFARVSATTVGSDTVLSTVTGVGSAMVRGLLVGTAGYLNVTMKNGQVCAALPFQAGINPGAFASIQTSTAGSPAQNVWVIM